MATKQTEELGIYCGSLEHLEDDSFLSYADILAWSEWEVKRITMPKLVEYISKSFSIGEDYNDLAGFVGKSITIDRIKSSGNITRGVCFPNGISLCEKDIMDSWIGYWQVNPKNYGFQDNVDIPANVCYGTFGMETVYVKDLYVKNLHTADSSGSSSSEMENATITNLTTNVLMPKSGQNIYINGHISFYNLDQGVLKYSDDTFKFDSPIEIAGNIETAGDSGSVITSLVCTNELSPRSTDYKGEYMTYMYGGFTFNSVYPNQKFLVASNDPSDAFNAAGGLTKIYSQSEIDDKIKALEARIAALESK